MPLFRAHFLPYLFKYALQNALKTGTKWTKNSRNSLFGTLPRMKLEAIAKVKNKLGLHLRPAAYIVKLLQNSESKVTLTYNGELVNARSIMKIMTLTVPKNGRVKIEVEGVDAEKTMSILLKAFKTEFKEEA